MSALLKINDLRVKIDDGNEILKGLSLEISKGEVHAIMGPNGSGKSTTSNVLAGKPGYEVTNGSIHFQGENINELTPDERVVQGVFLAFQYPVEIQGVTNTNFLRTSINSVLKAKGEDKMSPSAFLTKLKMKADELGISADMLKRSVNFGFSGGEKKRNEILQMAMLEPKLAILDETDSGLDIDALKVVSGGVNSLRSAERSFLVITHYQRLLNYITPDFVHIMVNGKIVKSGPADLALYVEKNGYSEFLS